MFSFIFPFLLQKYIVKNLKDFIFMEYLFYVGQIFGHTKIDKAFSLQSRVQS